MGSQTVAITIDVPVPNDSITRHPNQNSPRPADAFPPAAASCSSTSHYNEPAASSSVGCSGRRDGVDLEPALSGPVSGIGEGAELELRVRVWRAVRDYEWKQVDHTGRVLALALALCVPMLAVQTALKNMSDYYERAPLPGLDPLNRTLPDVLLNLWQPHTVRPPRATALFLAVTLVAQQQS